MPIPYKVDEDNYVYLVDRLGTAYEGVEMTDADRRAVATLTPLIHDETSFVVRKRDGDVYGLLMEVVELHHVDMEFADEEDRLDVVDGMTVNGTTHDGTSLPTLEDAVQELRNQAEVVQEAFPDLELEVAMDESTFDRCVAIRAFVPQDSPLVAELPNVAEAMHAVYARIRAAPAPAPATPGI